jgi:hypothetical protein
MAPFEAKFSPDPTATQAARTIALQILDLRITTGWPS